jgi:disulfide bond formation protein DsbB
MASIRTTTRVAFVLPALVCAALLGFGYYLQYGQGLQPCPLCLVQRGFFYAVMAVCVLAALHGPLRRGFVAFYSGATAFFAAGGFAAAARQVWLQHLPPERVPACGPDLYFMLENFPLARVLRTLIQGTGECAVVDWTFLGLSIAEWSLGWFAAIFFYALWLAFRRPAASPAEDMTFPEVDGKYR